MTAIDASAAAHATGLPANVPPRPPACTASITSARPVTPPIGMPRTESLRGRDQVGHDAFVLAREPVAGTAEPGLHLVGDEQRAVARGTSRRSPAASPASGTTNPPSPAIGSTTTHATCAGSTLASIHAIVSSRRARAAEADTRTARGRSRARTARTRACTGDTLAVSDRPSSVRPWNAWSNATTAGRPVAARAIFTAFSTASAPEFTSIDRFSPGHGRAGVQLLAHRDVALVRRHLEARVQERGRLLVDRGDDLGVRVPDVHDRDAGAHVDEAVAVDVLDDRSVRALRRRSAASCRSLRGPRCVRRAHSSRDRGPGISVSEGAFLFHAKQRRKIAPVRATAVW